MHDKLALCKLCGGVFEWSIIASVGVRFESHSEVADKDIKDIGPLLPFAFDSKEDKKE